MVSSILISIGGKIKCSSVTSLYTDFNFFSILDFKDLVWLNFLDLDVEELGVVIFLNI